MNSRKGLVLDANILLRAVFGVRVMNLLNTYENNTDFYSPDLCFTEAEKYVAVLAKRKGIETKLAQSVLDLVSRIVQSVDQSLYEDFEKPARERIERRDPRDWPVIAVAMLLNIPVWTEDQDFFGSGIPTWTTDRVEMYLRTGSEKF